MGQAEWDSMWRLEETGAQSAKHEARLGVGTWWREFLRGGPERAVRLTWGLWVSGKRLPSATVLVAHVASQLAPRGLVGLRSAAAVHGLLEAPEALDLVVPRGAWKTIAPWPFAHHRFTVTSTAGGDDVIVLPLEPGLGLRLTSRVRTVVDLLRFRARVGLPVVALALRRFLDAGGDVATLRLEARRLRAATALASLERLASALPPPPLVEDCRPLVFPPGLPERVMPFTPAR